MRLALITRKWTPEEFVLHEYVLGKMEMWGYQDVDLTSNSLVNHLLNIKATMEERISAVRRNGPYF